MGLNGFEILKRPIRRFSSPVGILGCKCGARFYSHSHSYNLSTPHLQSYNLFYSHSHSHSFFKTIHELLFLNEAIHAYFSLLNEAIHEYYSLLNAQLPE